MHNYYINNATENTMDKIAKQFKYQNGPGVFLTIEVEIDLDDLADQLFRKMRRTEAFKASVMYGAIKAKPVRA